MKFTFDDEDQIDDESYGRYSDDRHSNDPDHVVIVIIWVILSLELFSAFV